MTMHGLFKKCGC